MKRYVFKIHEVTGPGRQRGIKII